MIIVGLTGSIGMGKSTTASMFRDEGIRVHDADQTVHDLYADELVGPLEEAFPGVSKNGQVDRAELSKHVLGNEAAMKRLEAIVHPAVRKRENDFLDNARSAGEKFVILDIPLLFETKGNERVDKVIVVTASPEIQKSRVLAREGMNEEKFNQILGRQVPDLEKRSKADFIIETDYGQDHARERVKEIIKALSS